MIQRSILFLLLCKICSGQNLTFQKSFTNSYNIAGYYVQQTRDSGYIIAGSYVGAMDDVYLLKTDAGGNMVWNKTFGGLNPDDGYCVQQTKDGGYIVAGTTESFGSVNWSAYLIKTDSNGNLAWTKTYLSGSALKGNAVQQTTDGGYIIVGTAGNSVSTSVILIKTDSMGLILWNGAYAGNGFNDGNSVQQTADGGYIVTGTQENASLDLLFLKTDSSGILQWNKTYGSINNDEGFSVSQTSDGGYIAAGSAGIYTFLVKTDSNGDTLWTKNTGINSRSYSIRQTYDGGYICTGYSIVPSNHHDVFLIKTDSAGNYIWSKKYGGSDYEEGFCVQQTYDGGYIIAGHELSFSPGTINLYLIKTDSLGNSGCNESNLSITDSTKASQVSSPFMSSSVLWSAISGAPVSLTGTGGAELPLCSTVSILNSEPGKLYCSIYPNPVNDKLNIRVGTNERSEIILYDITSVKILQRSFTNSFSLNTSQLSKGIYFYEVKNKNGTIKNGKVVKQ